MESSTQASDQSRSSFKHPINAAINSRDHHEMKEKKKASLSFPSLGLVFVMVTSYALFCASGQTFITFASKVMLLLLTILFLWSKSAKALNRPLPSIPKMNISEETIRNAAIITGGFCNKILLGFENIALGKDSRLFYMVAFSLWIASIIGSYTHLINFDYIKSLMSR